MQNSMFYSQHDMTINQWLNMLAYEKPQEDPTHVFELNASESFEFNRNTQEPGIYYVRTSTNSLIHLKRVCQVRKLSFSDIVHLSDCLSIIITALVPPLKDLVKTGEAAKYLEELEDIFPSVLTIGLEKMRNKVWKQFFDTGWKRIVNRFFSAIANFFKKYDLYLETGIYWPGNSCAYADKVINQISVRKILDRTLQENRKLLSERFGISLKEMEGMNSKEIKNLWRKAAVKWHPDKNLDKPEATEIFKKMNSAYQDFEELSKLRDKIDLKLKNPKTEKSFSKGNPLLFRKKLLALPASVSIPSSKL